MTTPVDDLLTAIAGRARSVGPRPLVVALDGYSAAGKSTLAEQLSRALGAAVVPMDDFYGDEPEDVRLAYDAAEDAGA